MKCSGCGFENREEAKFCLKCGEKMELRCPQCRKPLPLEAMFCDECGHKLGVPIEAPSVDYSEPQSYTPKFLANKILSTRTYVEGERKLVTVLFADAANYTAMAEKLDPEEVHQIMDGCFKILMDEIHKYEGTITQFMGDGVMAIFGAPVAHEDHAQRACHAAISIQTGLWEYGEKIKKNTGVDFKMRIGLNSGSVIVGSVGDDLRMDYTALGDTVNLAARMEGLARPGSILVSTKTHKLVSDFFEFRSLGKVEIKGKEKPQEAYELIKAGEVETRIEAAAAKGLTKFVGRKNSMAALMEAYEKAQSRSGQVVGVVGEAGVGKSRLLFEFRNRLPQGEFTYHEGRCLHYGGTMAYLPILDILRKYFGIKEGDREFLIKKKLEERVGQLDESLRGALPFYQGLLSLEVQDEEYLKLEPKQKRDLTFEAIRDLLLWESQKKTVVLAVEDLQWIDRTSEEFLDYLIGWLANTKILLIILYRPEYTHQWGSKSYYDRIGLDQLTMESSAELVEAILEGADVIPELRDLILNRAAGNPLFMEEFTHTLLENGTIQRKDNQYVLSTKPSDVQVPDTIQGIIAARMDRLEDSLKRIMQVASVIGREFAFRLLQTITGMKEELKFHLLNLQGLEFIYEKTLFPELEYVFKHALIQEVAYNSLLQKSKKEIHKKIGEAIEQIYTERLGDFYEMLAYHYSKSDEYEKAQKYLRLSGDKAMRNHSAWEALRLYQETMNILGQMPESEDNKREQLEVVRSIYTPVLYLGYPEEYLAILQQGERLSNELGDERSLAWVYSMMGRYYAFAGNAQESLIYLERALEVAREMEDVHLMVQTGFGNCGVLWVKGDYGKLHDMASSILQLIEKTNKVCEFFGLPFSPYSMLCILCGLALEGLGRFDEGDGLCEKGLRFATETKELFNLANAEFLYAFSCLIRGNGTKGIRHLQNCLKYFEEWQYSGLSLALAFLGFGYYLVGDLETALRYTEEALKIQEDAGTQALMSYRYWVMGMVHCDSGHPAKAKEFAEKALELSQENSEKHLEGQSRALFGRILGKLNAKEIEKAEESILQGTKILEELKARPFLAESYLWIGELYASTGQAEKAQENLKKAGSMFQEMGMDYWLARTHAAYAELFKRKGDKSKARETLGKAIQIFKECGANGWVEEYEKELAALP